MRSIDIIELFIKQYPQIELPPAFFAFLEDQETNGHQIKRAGTDQSLRQFLVDLGVAPPLVSRVLDPASRLLLTTGYSAFVKRSSMEVFGYLMRDLAPIYALQQIILDSETITGFNRHGQDHVRTVAKRMLTLQKYTDLQSAKNRIKTNEALIAGSLHDVGNLMSRKDHGLYGMYLLTVLFTDVSQTPTALSSFLTVMEAMLFHEVDFGVKHLSRGTLKPTTLSLIIADKTDVRSRRVSSKSNIPEAISDAHTLVNLLATRSNVRRYKKAFDWVIHFSPRADNKRVSLFPALLKNTQRVWVPEQWQRLYREENVEYVFVFQATFLRVYFSRLLFTIFAVFVLFPYVEQFRLIISDDERGVSLSRVFTRNDHRQKLALIGKNLYKHNWGETPYFQLLGED